METTMKLYEIIKICNEALNLDIPSEYFEERQEESDWRIKTLVNCCNFVCEELYRDYATSIRKTVVEVTNGFADTSDYKMCRVLTLTDGEGNDVKFRYTDNGISVEKDGKYNMRYARLPERLGWNDVVTMPSPRITERIFVYGVAREFYLAIGDVELAKQWDERFKDALAVACSKTSPMRMPVRGWL